MDKTLEAIDRQLLVPCGMIVGRLWRWAVFGSLLGLASAAAGAPIYYQASGVMSGSLGSTAFTDALVDFTFVGDTSFITDVSTGINTSLPPGYAYFNVDPSATATVTVHLANGTVQTATFTQQMYWAVDVYNGGAGITAPAVAPAYPYALRTGTAPLNAGSYAGPISGSPFSCTNFNPSNGNCAAPAALTTTLGAFSVTSLKSGCPNFYLGIAPVPCQQQASYVAVAAPTLFVNFAGDGAGNVTSTPAAVNCSASCSAGVSVGATLALTATPAAGSVFAGWTGPCQGTSPNCPLTLSSGVGNVTAIFKQLSVASSITVGGLFTCSVNSATGLQCWGNDPGSFSLFPSYVGRPASAIPATAGGFATGVAAAAAGPDDHACALTVAGGVQCWGENYSGQLGDGSTSTSANPVAVPVQVSGLSSGVAAIASGAPFTCALTNPGGVQCWGDNTYGELGNNGTTSSSVPVTVGGLPGIVVSIAAGGGADPVDSGIVGAHACALTGGAVWCWGDNNGGQLGNGTTGGFSAGPVAVTGLSGTVVAVSAGGLHTCALNTAGAVQCWGLLLYGTGNPATTPGSFGSAVPADVSGLASGVTAIAAGADHSCALTGAGAVLCWGDNTFGELGDGTTTSSPGTPVVVGGLPTDVIAIATGGGNFLGGTINRSGANTCALTAGGAVWCWGDNSGGQLGTSSTSLISPTPVQIVGFGNNGVGPPRPNPLAITMPPGPPAPIAQEAVGGPSFNLAATTGSGLAAAFASATPDRCTVTGTSVHFFAPGVCVVLASQAGDATYGPAPTQTREILVVAGSTSPAPTVTTLASSGSPWPAARADGRGERQCTDWRGDVLRPRHSPCCVRRAGRRRRVCGGCELQPFEPRARNPFDLGRVLGRCQQPRQRVQYGEPGDFSGQAESDHRFPDHPQPAAGSRFDHRQPDRIVGPAGEPELADPSGVHGCRIAHNTGCEGNVRDRGQPAGQCGLRAGAAGNTVLPHRRPKASSRRRSRTGRSGGARSLIKVRRFLASRGFSRQSIEVALRYPEASSGGIE